MHPIVAQIRELEQKLDSLLGDVFVSEGISDLLDDDIAELLATTGRMNRRIEATQVEAADAVNSRSTGMRDERMTDRYGCARPADLVRLLLGSDTRTAVRLVRAANRVHRDRSVTEGGFLPSHYPALREALVSGGVGVDGLLAATDPIERAARRISDEARLAADAYLADVARGVDPDRPDAAPDAGSTPLSLPEDLNLMAKTILAYLDPDGDSPIDELAERARFLTIGSVNSDGVVPLHGALLPDVAAQLKLLLDSLLNPRAAVVGRDAGGADATISAGAVHSGSAFGGVQFEPSGPDDLAFDHVPEDSRFVDLRRRPQKLHDALASILMTAAGTDLFPHLGGVAPTLVVTATAADLARGSGWAALGNTGDTLSVPAAAHIGCAGGVQRVLFDDYGRVVSIGTSARIFNALQRRAIMARDGGCVIPGCTIPAMWCEVHHVQEHAKGGATHTNNGVLLCWFHHRTIDTSEWSIRMHLGMPQVRGPRWWDPHQRWRSPLSSYRRPAFVGYGPPGSG